MPRAPARNKLLVTTDGTWVVPGSLETDGDWDAFADRSADRGNSWTMSPVPPVHQRSRPVQAPARWLGLTNGVFWHKDLGKVLHWDGVLQPSLWESSAAHLHMLMRSTRGWLYRSDSTDNRRAWSEAYATRLPNNNSGIDLVKMDSGGVGARLPPGPGQLGGALAIDANYLCG